MTNLSSGLPFGPGWANSPTVPTQAALYDIITSITPNAVVEVTGTTVNLVPNTVYIMNNAALITATLPATMSVGSFINIIGKGAGGWRIAQQANQIIRLGATSTTTGTGGSVSSSNRYDSTVLRNIVANLEFNATSRNGNLVVV